MLLWEKSQQVFHSVVVSTLHLEKSGGGATTPAALPAPPSLKKLYKQNETKNQRLPNA